MTFAASSFLSSLAFLGLAITSVLGSWAVPVAAIAVVLTAIACAIAMEERDLAPPEG